MKIHDLNDPSIAGKYSVIYADPGWKYRDKANAGKRGACHKYTTMSVDQICALPVANIAAPDCVLVMCGFRQCLPRH